VSRLRIDLASPPFAGHLNPILGIARILHPRYDIRVLTTRSGMPAVDAAGIRGIVMLEGWEDRLTSIVDTRSPVGLNPLKMFKQVTEALDLQIQIRKELERLYEKSRPALLIADFTLPVAGDVARRLDIPWWTSLPSPCVLEGGNGPPAYFGGLKPSNGPLGRGRDEVGRLLTRLFKHAFARVFRRRFRLIGLASLYRADGSEAVYSDQRILAFGSRRIEFRSHWPDYVRLCQPPLYTPPVRDRPPPFIAGRRHVLITLGTHLNFAKSRMAMAVRQLASAMPELEFHFTDGSASTASVLTEQNFSRLSFVNYQKYLSRYALVIHHGGSGIMYHTLAAGCPAVVLPMDYDQFDNAARLEHAGLALRLRSQKKLRSAVKAALQDRGLSERCARFALEYQREESHDILQDVDGLSRTWTGALPIDP
jgi:UDP:flavonoid glycosyltransferase YjiC (YdhE family)